MTTKKFQDEYAKLNSEQKKAVDAIEGTVIVMAGPGTGKTQILSLRIANILLKTQVGPENILALTFTNSGVHSMKKRLIELIGANTAHRINIETFHSFCEKIIKTKSDYFPQISNSDLITEIKQIDIIENILKNEKFKILRPWGDDKKYIKPILTAIGEIKRNGLNPEEFKEKIQEQKQAILDDEKSYYQRKTGKANKGELKPDSLKPVAKNEELLNAYTQYQEKLKESKSYDYNDMILEVLNALRKEDSLLSDLQETYHYILVDEHQDTNDAQNKILDLLVSFFDRPNLFIVGDDKQAIYRFQGASLENFLYFDKKFKDITVVNLKNNYRSTQRILDASHNLIQNNSQKIESGEKLYSKIEGEGEKILVRSFPDYESEIQNLTEDILKKIKKEKVNPDEIAVVYRKNDEVFKIIPYLEKFNIPFVIESKQDIFADNEIKKIILLFQGINEFGNERLFSEILHIDFFNINPLDIYKLIDYSRKNKISLYDALEQKEFSSEIIEVKNKLTEWKKVAENENLIFFFEKVVRESGSLLKILKTGKIDKLNKLFNQIQKIMEENRSAKLVDFISFIKLVDTHNLSLETKNTFADSGIRLMTAHKTKGLEFDYIYIIGVTDGKWGNNKKQNDFKLPLDTATGEIDDERRLFYVALTRARKKAYISYHRQNLDGKNLIPSLFIDEIGPEFLHFEELNIKADLEKIFLEKNTPSDLLKNKEYLNKKFLDIGLSATGLNDYLSCPWTYFYRNLIKLPSTFSKNLEYGIIVHSTLENFFEKIRKGEPANKNDLINIFERKLNKSLLAGRDLVDVKEKGILALAGYYDQYKNNWTKNIINELFIKGIAFNIGKNKEITLTGKLDKIEILNNQNEVNVVDYKTGKIKSRKKLEGEGENADGNNVRQLIFYKILLDNFDNKKYKMVSGEIDFIEPNEKGKYIKEKFNISEENIRGLENKIKEVSNEILNLDFWDKICDDKNCEYCKLRKIMN